ncbi:tetratricopeptide repeat protein [Pelagicoccus mobilis]|uniref:Tetratricopeptide repeat protein n=1 Tax=Pelagicoccus mobilis TaxID=415221 RepID=A0A934RY90_9BACT|nr:tetratricopeptide repeat protein [Pelagicoccus mobilis]MBK1877680.1 tetratricopeptide repeat protein [Pelagicoccus mobilis]
MGNFRYVTNLIIIVTAAWIPSLQSKEEHPLDIPRPAVSHLPNAFSLKLDEIYHSLAEDASDPELYGKLGMHYHSNGFLESAIIAYERSIALRSDHAKWHYYKGSVFLLLGDSANALPSLQKASQLAPNHTFVTLKLADARYSLGHSSKALTLYEEISQKQPENPLAIIGMARCLTNLGETARAENILIELSQEHPSASTPFSLLYHLYSRSGDTEKRNAVKQKMKGLDNILTDNNPWLAELNEYCYDIYRLTVIADQAERSGSFDNAIKTLRRAVALSPDSDEAYYQLGRMHARNNSNTKAIAHLQIAQQKNPHNVEASQLLAETLHFQGKTEQALETVKRSISQTPNSELLQLQLGFLLQESGNKEAAITAYRKAIDIDPQNRKAIKNLGNLLVEQRQPEGLDWLDKYIRIKGDDTEVRISLGNLYAKAGNFSKAIDYLEPAYRLAPQNTDLQRALAIAYLRLAVDLANKGNIERAIARLESSVETDNDFTDARFNLALLYLNTGQAPKAESHARTLLAATPKDLELTILLARSLSIQHRNSEAISVLEAFESETPNLTQAEKESLRTVWESIRQN